MRNSDRLRLTQCFLFNFLVHMTEIFTFSLILLLLGEHNASDQPPKFFLKCLNSRWDDGMIINLKFYINLLKKHLRSPLNEIIRLSSHTVTLEQVNAITNAHFRSWPCRLFYKNTVHICDWNLELARGVFARILNHLSRRKQREDAQNVRRELASKLTP